MSRITKIRLSSGETYDVGAENTGMKDSERYALLRCFKNLPFINDSNDIMNGLEAALFPEVVETLSAVFTQSNTVYDTDDIDSLRDFLVVTADNVTVNNYTLGGALTPGNSTIYVFYGNKITSFSVIVTEDDGWRNNQLILTSDKFGYGIILEISPYHDNYTARVNYIGFEVMLSAAYQYTVTFESELENAQVGVRKYTAAQVERIQNGLSAAGTDSGWQSNGYSFTGTNGGMAWFVLQDNDTNISPNDFPSITITREALV